MTSELFTAFSFRVEVTLPGRAEPLCEAAFPSARLERASNWAIWTDALASASSTSAGASRSLA